MNDIVLVNPKLSIKKDLILDAINMGMALETSYTYAECDEDEIKTLSSDIYFQQKVGVVIARLEFAHLELHKAGMIRAAMKGNVMAVQWKLERMNRSRWGTSKEPENTTMPVIVFEEDDRELI